MGHRGTSIDERFGSSPSDGRSSEDFGNVIHRTVRATGLEIVDTEISHNLMVRGGVSMGGSKMGVGRTKYVWTLNRA